MFQFTREFIINDNVGKLGGTLKDLKFGVVNDTLVVDRMVNIRKEDVVSIHKHAYQPEANSSVTLDLTQVKASAKDAIVRFVISIRQEGKVSALVNDQYPWHTKQYFYEIKASAATLAAADAKAVEAQAKKEAVAEAEDRLIDVTASATGAKLTIAATDCYTRIHEVRIVEVRDGIVSPVTAGTVLTGNQDYKVLARVDAKDIAAAAKTPSTLITAAVVGTEGTGTVARILKNMRLLTDAHLDPYGLQRDERPLPRGKYDQYTIECVSERRHIGAQVFGAIDHSLTTYVFFVAQASSDCAATSPSAEFKEVLEKLGAVCEVSTVDDGVVTYTKHKGGKADVIAAEETSDNLAAE